MIHESKRILTTHVGSLPRPEALFMKLMDPQSDSRPDFESALQRAVQDVVAIQSDCGIDIVDDGEYSKESFITYAHFRIAGFTEADPPRAKDPWAGSREVLAFPEFYANEQMTIPEGAPVPSARRDRVCSGPLSYKGDRLLQRDIANLKAAIAAAGVDRAFMPAIAPACIEDWFANEYYQSDEEYLFAIADAMRHEYHTIIDAGLDLQIDDPLLASKMLWRPEWSVQDARRWAVKRIEALNYALRGLPQERIRHHTCHAVDAHPRTTDMELKDIMDLTLTIDAGAYSFEAANPRHEHEFTIWDELELPQDKKIIPGVVTNSSVVVEHPELVAQRLVRFGERVGPENVIAGTDCGFATFASPRGYDWRIIKAKLMALAEGAQRASKHFWH